MTVNDDIQILIRPCSEETHRKTVDAWARQLAVLQDEVRAWCDLHPGAVEEAARWLEERRPVEHAG